MILMTHNTDTGRKRDHNEDACQSFEFEINGRPAYALILADGMGGHAAGEIAADIFIRTCAYQLRKPGESKQPDPQTIMENIFQTANAAIFESAQKTGKKGMGCTGLIGIIYNGIFHGGWLGDSRIYLFRDNVLKRLSKDHSVVQNLVDLKEITEAEARAHPKKNLITKAVGLDSRGSRPGFCEERLRRGDAILLCSDGLSGEVEDHEIGGIIGRNLRKEKDGTDLADTQREDKTVLLKPGESGNYLAFISRELIHTANQNGGSDNISVVLAHYDEDAVLPAEAIIRKKVPQVKLVKFSKIFAAFAASVIFLLGAFFLAWKVIFPPGPGDGVSSSLTPKGKSQIEEPGTHTGALPGKESMDLLKKAEREIEEARVACAKAGDLSKKIGGKTRDKKKKEETRKHEEKCQDELGKAQKFFSDAEKEFEDKKYESVKISVQSVKKSFMLAKRESEAISRIWSEINLPKTNEAEKKKKKKNGIVPNIINQPVKGEEIKKDGQDSDITKDKEREKTRGTESGENTKKDAKKNNGLNLESGTPDKKRN